MFLTSRALGSFSRPKTLTRGFAALNGTHFREPDPSKPRLVLAYSGGLDTSCQLSWLAKEKGYEVCAYIADLGQDDTLDQSAIDAIREKAEISGAYAFYCEDLKEDFVENYVFKSIQASALYEGRYLLGTSIARPCISKRQVEICKAEKATHISHGSTGKGNDQVRFELAYLGMDPTLTCVTMWRDPEYLETFQGRLDLIDYAEREGIPVSATKKVSFRYRCACGLSLRRACPLTDRRPLPPPPPPPPARLAAARARTCTCDASEDENCMHISYESGELEDPAFPGHTQEYPAEMWKKTTPLEDTPDTPCNLTIDFVKGNPVKVTNVDDGTVVTGSLDLFLYLNKVGGEHGVGREDIVENRFVGMKSRGCYECPGGAILYRSHLDLETLCMDREVMRIRDGLTVKFSELAYNGFWFTCVAAHRLPAAPRHATRTPHARSSRTFAADSHLSDSNPYARSPEMTFLRSTMELSQKAVTGSVDVRLFKGNVINRGRSSPFSLYNQDLVSMDIEGGFNAEMSTGFIQTLSTRLKASAARDLTVDAAEAQA